MLIYCDVPLNLNIQNKYRTYYKRHSEQIISVATTLHSQRSVLNCMPSAKMRPGQTGADALFSLDQDGDFFEYC